MPYLSLYRGVTVGEEDAEHLILLSPNHREMLGKTGTYEDIATEMNLPLGTVRSRLHRARAALTKMREAAAV